MQLAKIEPAMAQASPAKAKPEKLEDVLKKGLEVPWLGLRPDLLLHKGAPDENGDTTYIIEDPVRGDHFEIGEEEAKFFLCLLKDTDLITAVKRLYKTTPVRPTVKDIIMFLRLLQGEQLAVMPEDGGDNEALEERKKAMAEASGKVKNPTLWQRFNPRKYLFMMIPVARPDTFITKLHNSISFLWSKPFLYIYGVMALTGLVMMFQQLDTFLHSTSYLFTFKGFLAFLFCMFVLKVFHEFGHALAAKHYGIFVRRMGIYMMAGTPMLYTDATEAWKIPTRKGRLVIGAAGVLVEIYVGGLALFFWAVLPDGILRSLMFFTSSAAVISTLFTNISPFMRFDGYYILMDYLRITNLRSRSMALFKYYYYRILVAWQGPKPEEHPREKFMALFGLGCTIYFAIIVISIHIAVAQTIGELVAIYGGALTFAIFFAVPFWKTTTYPFKNREHFGSKIQVLIRILIIALLFTWLSMPGTTKNMVPAYFLYKDVARMESPGRGRLANGLPKQGAMVNKGELLAKIVDDQMAQELERIRFELMMLSETIKNMGSDGAQGGYRKWLLVEKDRLLATMGKMEESLAQLEIRAPMSGKVLDVNQMLEKGSYLSKKGYLLTVGEGRMAEVRAYAHEKLYRKLKERTLGNAKIVILDLETERADGVFREMHDFPVSDFPNNTIFDFAGGPITSLPSSQGKGSFEPRDPHYPIFFDLANPPEYLSHGSLCYALMEEKTLSPINRFGRWFWRLLAKLKVV